MNPYPLPLIILNNESKTPKVFVGKTQRIVLLLSVWIASEAQSWQPYLAVGSLQVLQDKHYVKVQGFFSLWALNKIHDTVTAALFAGNKNLTGTLKKWTNNCAWPK